MLVLAGLGAACASGPPLPGGEGAALYRAKCGGCHRLYAPSEQTAEQWKKRLPEMRKRAKLTPDEYRVIERYVGLAPELEPSHGGTAWRLEGIPGLGTQRTTSTHASR